MNKSIVRKLNFGKKLLLSAAGVAAIALPIVFGLAKPAHSQPQSSSENMSAKTVWFYSWISASISHAWRIRKRNYPNQNPV